MCSAPSPAARTGRGEEEGELPLWWMSPVIGPQCTAPCNLEVSPSKERKGKAWRRSVAPWWGATARILLPNMLWGWNRGLTEPQPRKPPLPAPHSSLLDPPLATGSGSATVFDCPHPKALFCLKIKTHPTPLPLSGRSAGSRNSPRPFPPTVFQTAAARLALESETVGFPALRPPPQPRAPPTSPRTPNPSPGRNWL